MVRDFVKSKCLSWKADQNVIKMNCYRGNLSWWYVQHDCQYSVLFCTFEDEMMHNRRHRIRRDHSRHGLNQRETTLHCNVVSHWLSTYPELSLVCSGAVLESEFSIPETPTYRKPQIDIKPKFILGVFALQYLSNLMHRLPNLSSGNKLHNIGCALGP